jgi:hypothetical protein
MPSSSSTMSSDVTGAMLRGEGQSAASAHDDEETSKERAGGRRNDAPEERCDHAAAQRGGQRDDQRQRSAERALEVRLGGALARERRAGDGRRQRVPPLRAQPLVQRVAQRPAAERRRARQRTDAASSVQRRAWRTSWARAAGRTRSRCSGPSAPPTSWRTTPRWRLSHTCVLGRRTASKTLGADFASPHRPHSARNACEAARPGSHPTRRRRRGPHTARR